MSGISHHALQNLHSSESLPSAAGPSQKSSKGLDFLSPNSSTLFFAQNFKNLREWTPTGRPVVCGGPNPPKNKNNLKNTTKKTQSTEAHDPQNQAFRLKQIAFSKCCSIKNKVCKIDSKRTLKYPQHPSKWCQSQPTTMPKNQHKNNHKRNAPKSDLGANIVKNRSQHRTE